MEKRTFVYTEWDFRNEERCHDILVVVKRVCEDFRGELTSEIETQSGVIDSLWEVSQRYQLLHGVIPSFNTYPELITRRVDQEILYKINDCLKKIRESNAALLTTLKAVKQKILEFETAVKKVDPRCGSPFVDGNSDRKPIYFYIDMLRDVYYYLRKTVAKLVFAERFIDYKDPKSIDVYKSIINRPSKHATFVNLKFL